MASVFDVANYILESIGPITAMKLQKLVYYSQAWSLVWDDDVLFDEKIEAWANGPVVPVLYQEHKGQFKVDRFAVGDSSNLTENQKDTIDNVLGFYGDKSSQWLSDLTHSEFPWIQAREGLPNGYRGNKEIELSVMVEYYSSL